MSIDPGVRDAAQVVVRIRHARRWFETLPDVGDYRRVSDARNPVELQIHDVRNSQWFEATATVRNLGGPVVRGARFDRVDDSAGLIDLELTRIVWYEQTVDEIPRGHTALVTLRGSGARVLRSGSVADGWQRIEGRNDQGSES